MKRLVFFAALLTHFQLSGLMANPVYQSAEIRTFNYAPIKVWIDGNGISSHPESVQNIHGIRTGKHLLKIVKYEPGHFNAYHHVIYKGYIIIKPNTLMEIIVDRRNRLRVSEKINRPKRSCGHQNKGQNCCDNDRDNYYEDNGYNWNKNHNATLSQHEFNKIERLIRKQSFESAKMDIAKQALQYNWMTSKQVRDIMYLFSYESSKLSFAKYAFYYTIDKERFYRVNDAFTYRSSVAELEAFLSRSY